MSLIVLFFVAFASLYTYFDDENKRDDAERIARKDFHFDEISLIVSGSSYSEVVDPDRRTGIGYIYYVLGERNGEDALIIVPRLKSEEPYEAEWSLCEPFEACMEKFGEVLGRPVTKEDYAENRFAVEFLDNDHLIEEKAPLLKWEGLDVNFVICFLDKYFLAQVDGELVVYYRDVEWLFALVAKRSFMLTEVLSVSCGTVESELIDVDTLQPEEFPVYVVAKDYYGDERFFVFFTKNTVKGFEAEWPLCEAFGECLNKFGEYRNEPVVEREYKKIEFLDNKLAIEECVPTLKGQELDVNFMVLFDEKYAMVQIDGALIIYTLKPEGWVSSSE